MKERKRERRAIVLNSLERASGWIDESIPSTDRIIERVRLSIKVLVRSLYVLYAAQFENRWPGMVSEIRRCRSDKCVIAHKSASARKSGDQRDAYLCWRSPDKLNSHISSALYVHISCKTAICRRYDAGRNFVVCSRDSVPVVARAYWIVFIGTYKRGRRGTTSLAWFRSQFLGLVIHCPSPLSLSLVLLHSVAISSR